MNEPESNSKGKAKWLNSNIIGMSLASFFSDTGHEAATAILPLFLTAIGAPAAALGAIEGLADAVSSFVKLWSGWFSDRIGKRKPIAVMGYVLTGLTTGLFGFATSWTQVLLARSAGWLGRGIRGPVRDSMLAESVPPEAQGRAFGFHRAGDTLGAIVGPVLALALVSLLGHGQAESTSTIVSTYRQIFFITLIPGILSAVSFGLFVRERLRAPNPTDFFLTVRNLPIPFKKFLVGVGIFGAGDFAHSLLTMRAAQILSPALGLSRAGQVAMSLYIIRNIVYAGSSFPVGVLADRIGKRRTLSIGYFFAAVMAMGWMVPLHSIWYLGVLFVLGGLYIAVEDSLEGAVTADLLPDEVYGTGYGVLATVNGLGDFVSSMVVGLLWSLFNPVYGFAYAGILFIVGAVLVSKVR